MVSLSRECKHNTKSIAACNCLYTYMVRCSVSQKAKVSATVRTYRCYCLGGEAVCTCIFSLARWSKSVVQQNQNILLIMRNTHIARRTPHTAHRIQGGSTRWTKRIIKQMNLEQIRVDMMRSWHSIQFIGNLYLFVELIDKMQKIMKTNNVRLQFALFSSKTAFFFYFTIHLSIQSFNIQF